MKGITRSGKAGSSLQILKNLDYQTREFDIYLIGDGEPRKDFKQKSDAL